MSKSVERLAVGLDIGGTKMLGVVVDEHGVIRRELRKPSPVHDLDALVAVCAQLVDDIAPPGAPVGVGIAGLVDRDGRLAYAPNIPGVRDAPLRDALVTATGRDVVADNDANVAALGEATFGAAAGAGDALMITLGTGIGGGIITNGDIYRGAHGFAGELGHFTVERDGPRCACGEAGHWEAIASGSALGRMARELVGSGRGDRMLAAAAGDVREVSGEDVAIAAAAGDADACALLEQFADNVAIGLANLANIFDPEQIVISGGLVEMGVLLFEPLAKAFARRLEGTEHRPHIPITAATLGHRAGAVGAAVLARRRFLR
jgi:glucokinase